MDEKTYPITIGGVNDHVLTPDNKITQADYTVCTSKDEWPASMRNELRAA